MTKTVLSKKDLIIKHDKNIKYIVLLDIIDILQIKQILHKIFKTITLKYTMKASKTHLYSDMEATKNHFIKKS